MHSGPVQVRFGKTHVSVLCPLGHLVTSAPLDRSWGGSAIEAKISGHQAGTQPWTIECDGAERGADDGLG